MNKIFKIVFNKETGVFTAVAEFAKAQGKSSSCTVGSKSSRFVAQTFTLTALAAGMMLSSSVWAYSSFGGNVTGGDNDKTLAMMSNAVVQASEGIAIGSSAISYSNATGQSAQNVAIGQEAKAITGAVAIGYQANTLNSSGQKGTNQQSVAIGYQTVASGDQSTAVGAQSKAGGNSSVAIGGDDLDKVASSQPPAWDNQALTAAQAKELNNTAAAKKYEQLTGDILVHFENSFVRGNQVTKTAGMPNRYTGTEAGEGSVAVGVQSQAKGALAAAFGTRTSASGTASVALGVGALATKDGSFAGAAGAQSTGISSIALGTGSKAQGNQSIAMGDGAIATEVGAIAQGFSANATAISAISIGRETNATKENAVALSRLANATGEAANAIGFKSEAHGTNSVALGTQAVVTAGALAGVAIGEKANASNTKSIAIGAASKSSGDKSIAVGDQANATSEHSFAMGGQSAATNRFATAVGSNSAVSGEYGTAVGKSASVSGRMGSAFGTDSKASGESSTAVGRAANATGSSAIAMGSGANATNSNAIATGTSATAAASSSIAIGNEANVASAAVNSIAMGYKASSTQQNSVSLGREATTASNYSTALGANAKVAENLVGAVALGNHATAQAGVSTNEATVNGITYSGFAGNSILHRSGTESYVVSVGDAQTKRQIQNVAAGQITKTSTDAINGSQLYMVADEVAKSREKVTSNDKTVTVKESKDASGSTVFDLSVNKATAPTINTDGKVQPIQNGDTSFVTGDTLVNTINAAGFNVAGNGTKTNELVNPGDTVDFVNGKGTTANVSVVDGKNTIKYDINVDDKTIKVGDDGKLTVINNVEDTNDIAKVVAGDNIQVDSKTEGNTTTFTVATKKDLVVDSVKAGDTTINNDGLKVGDVTVTNSPITVNGNTVNNINDAINQTAEQAFKPLTFGGDKGNDVTRKLGEKVNVKGGATGELSSGNIAVEADGTDTLNIKLAKELKDINSITINNGPTINNNGINMDSDKITNLEDGEDDGDAVNVKQMKASRTTVTSSDNSISVVDTNNGKGDNFAYDIKVNNQAVVENAQTPVVYTNKDGDKVYKQPDGTFNTKPDGSGDKVNPADVIASMNSGDNSTNNPTTLANVKSNLAPVTPADKSQPDANNPTKFTANQLNNAATLGDVLNAGWNLQGNGKAVDTVVHNDTVNFVNGVGTTAKVETTDGKISTVTYDVNVDNKTITTEEVADPNNPGNKITQIKANTTELKDENKDGKVDAPSNEDGDKLVNAKNVADAINSSGFNLKTSATEGEKLSGDDELINPGDSVEMVAGKNLTVKQETNGKVTYTTKENVTFTSVQLGDNGPKITNKDGDINIGDKNNNPVNITNVKSNLAPTYNSGDKKIDDKGKPTDEVVNTPTKQQEAPKPADVAKMYNNAATVGDVLNAGWNLQENSTEKDFVKAYDTVNFVNGTGTVANVSMNADGTIANVTFNVANTTLKASEAPTTANNNTPIGKIEAPTEDNKNNFVNAGDLATAINSAGFTVYENNATLKATVTAGDQVSFNNGNYTTAVVETENKDGRTNVTFNVDGVKIVSDNSPVVYTKADGSKVYKQPDGTFNTQPDGKGDKVEPSDVIASMQNADGNNTTKPMTLTNVANGTTTLNGDNRGDKTDNPTAIDKTTPFGNNLSNAYNGLADLINAPVSNAVTVGDLRNLGWVVSATGNNYADDVRNANEVRFVGQNGLAVTGETDKDGVRVITVSANAGSVVPTEAVTTADNKPVVKVGDNYYKTEDIDPTTGKPKQDAQPIPADQVKNTPNAGNSLVTGNQVADAIQVAGFVVGKQKETLAVSDFKNEDERVNPDDHLRFADGKSTIASLATKAAVDASGKVVTTTTVKVDVDLPIDYKYTDKDGNEVVKHTDGKFYPVDPKTGLADTSKEAIDTVANPVTKDGAKLTNGSEPATSYEQHPDFDSIEQDKKDELKPGKGGVNLNNVAWANEPDQAVNKDQLDQTVAKSGFFVKQNGESTLAANKGSKNDNKTEKVTPNDVVNFVNGTNTQVNATTEFNDETGQDITNVRVDVVGLPVTYTTKDGDKVAKASDGNYYKVDPTTGLPKVGEGSKVEPNNIVASMVSPNGDSTTAPTTLTNVAAGTNTLDGSVDNNGKPLVKYGDQYYTPDQLENGKLKDGAVSSVPAKTVDAYNGLADLDTVSPSNVMTVADAKKLGWVVSADGNNYADDVRNANEVKFKGEGLATVTGATNATTGVREITVSVKTGDVTKSNEFVVRKDGVNTPVVKVGDNYYTKENIDPTTGKPKDGAEPVNTEGATIVNNGAGLVTGNQVADAIQASGFTVGKGNTEGVTFDNKDEKVNPDDELRLADSDTTTVALGTTKRIDPNGEVKTTTTVKVDVANTTLDTNDKGSLEAPNTDADKKKFVNAGDLVNAINKTGFNLKTSANGGEKLSGSDELINPGDSVEMIAGKNLTVKQEANGKVTYATKDDVQFNSVTSNKVIVGDAADPAKSSTLTSGDNGLDVGGDKITNVADGDISPVSTDVINGKQLNNYTKVNGNNIGTDQDGSINIVNGNGTTVTSDKAGEIKVNVNNTDLTVAEEGTINVQDPNGTGAHYVNANTVAKAVNEVSWSVNSETDKATANAATQNTYKPVDNKVKAGSQVKVNAGRNVEISGSGRNINVAVSDNPEFNSVKVGGTKLSSKVAEDGVNELNIGGNNNAPTRITNVAAGVKNTDAVNVSQLKGAVNNLDNKINRNNRDLRAGIAGANAAAGLPQVYIPGKSMVAAAAGTFKGENALAVGYSRSSDNGKVILKLQGNANTRGDLGGSVGVGYQW